MRDFIQKINRKVVNRFIKKNSNPIVNFIVCGTQKGGTSALDAYLREHINICMATKKEVHFFDNEDFFSNKIPDYSLYHSNFTHITKHHKAIGESTPIYMYWHNAPKRIWTYNPKMKLIVVLRNPIDRAYSHWNMEQSRNKDNLSFWDAIQNEKERCQAALPYQHRTYSYVDRGFYLEQLQRLWFYFSKDRVLILKYEHLKNQAQETLRDICNFLEVDQFEYVNVKNVHSIPYKSKMTEIEKEYLQSVFKSEIQNIERVLGWDCNDWLSE